MESLKALIAECGGEKKSLGAETSSMPSGNNDGAQTKDAGGRLLICACIDYESASKANPDCLEAPHAVELPSRVSKCFSSSSSLQFFILCEDALYVVGKNDRGQLGTNDRTTYNSPQKVNLSKLSLNHRDIKKITTGRSHTLMLLENGDVYGCGSNEHGQLGLGDGKNAREYLEFTKISALSNVRDIACGYDHSLACDETGALFTFGHPMYGQLGFGSDGSFIRDGGRKGAAIQYDCVYSPKKIEKFLRKDNRDKVIGELTSAEVKIRLVAAGKNHSICVEDWENDGLNRLFSWGFGGYGRLGHNSGNDELIPREIATFQTVQNGAYIAPTNVQKMIRSITCGATVSMAISKSGHLYFWGKLSNSPRGEATTYPKIDSQLYGWNCKQCAAGSNLVLVTADDACVGWGVPVAGKIGLEGDARSCTAAKFVDAVAGLNVLDVSCGYGHVCYVVSADGLGKTAEDKLAAFPVFTAPSTSSSSGNKRPASTEQSSSSSGAAASKKKAKK